MLTAITRGVSPCIGECHLTYLSRQNIDFQKASRQQKAYEQCLADLRVKVVPLPVEAKLPDSVFVEDTAVVVDEIAIIPVMGAVKRRPEVQAVATALSQYRQLTFLNNVGTLEGGDKIRIGRTLYVGVSTRTNHEGITQLRKVLQPYDYRVKVVEVNGCLHLTTGCTYIGQNTILANTDWVDVSPFKGFDVIDVSRTEPWAANALKVNDVVVIPSAFPVTRATLEERGFSVLTIDISEHLKAEAGLTCMSIIFNSSDATSNQIH